MRRWLAVAAAVAGGVAVCAVFGRALIHLLGIDTQQSDNYDFVSGVGPMFLTALLGSSVLATLWHSLNCHQDGCWRVGRHKVKGTPWCNRHHKDARVELTLEDKLDRLIELLTEQAKRQ